MPAIHPLLAFGPTRLAVCTYQAISGAGKTFETWPEMVDNVIPFISGEEEKSEQEPLKIWGTVKDGAIHNASAPTISAQCIRVPVSDGHMAAVFVEFQTKPTREQILAAWQSFSGPPQAKKLPSAPSPFLQYFDEPNRPQTKLDRDLGNGQAISIGRLRPDSLFELALRRAVTQHGTRRGRWCRLDSRAAVCGRLLDREVTARNLRIAPFVLGKTPNIKRLRRDVLGSPRSAECAHPLTSTSRFRCDLSLAANRVPCDFTV